MAQDESFRGEKRYIKPSLKNPRGRGRRIDGGKNFDDNDPDMDRVHPPGENGGSITY